MKTQGVRRWRAAPFTSGDEYSTGGHRNGACIRATLHNSPAKWYWQVIVWSKLDADVTIRRRFASRATAQAYAERWLAAHEKRKGRL